VSETPRETPENRLRRLRVRSWHRGIREMDLILGRFSDARLGELSPGLLEAFDMLLSENDHDLYRWIGGGAGVPPRYEELVGRIRAYHGIGA
jgi:antitoxin CptB